MVSLKFLSLALIPFALGRVTDVTGPNTASPGSNITMVLQSNSYIQNWDDFGVIWGLRPASLNTCGECLGTELGYTDLYSNPAYTPIHGNSSFPVTIPGNTPTGGYTLVAAIPYLVGASGETGIRYFNHTISIA